MQLKKVYANKSSFRTVEFNETGLSFIVAKQKDPENKSNGKTYNGVGKSLIVNIIHFCMGSKKKNYTSFCNKLPGWEFYLEFFIGGVDYTAKRSTDNPNKIILNDEELTLTKFNAKMESVCFNIPDDISHLSFRSLFPFFIRPNKKWYVDFNGASSSYNQYQTMLYNAFLLGLDVFLAQKKYNIKKEQDRIKTLEGNFKNDELLRDFFTGNKDVTLTIVDLEEQIEKLNRNLSNFKVAEDYRDVQKEADRIESELFALNNKIILIQNNIESVNKSLNMESKTDQNDIAKVYEEANVHFSENLQKTLNDLERFYEKLVSNRKKRLLEQKNKFESEIAAKSQTANKLKNELDHLMKYLGDHQALDVFLSLSDKSAHLKTKLESLKKYQSLQLEYKEKLRDAEKIQLEQSEIAENFLAEIETEINVLRDYFRSLAKRFYPNAVAGLSVSNNDGENLQRYNIDAKIESDNSDGINNVKIFCYDMTLLFKGQNHNINFLFHDSRLFDGIDERQKAELFKIVYEEFVDSKKQYIATVNQNQLNEIKDYLEPELFQKIINDNTVLTLTDDHESEKLLGITIDINDD
ncbi:DUF2326 domain-containing protein [Alkalicella caledoniensis]|uniref:DUF2326 domain-containing protein n=1 Tax=Alkalicella caledoniensis TaxID=2731377 RepID=A0A7G9W3Q1_ALKCA|nr:DUF2326 domain-containing protein [Alkalicella caledoniensis]QNO13313.1 DUF2326 domain-containing protein [Alkalicella caledoniensis]